ncbi:cytochrome P450 [Streptomyces sp. NBC_01387]|uniref:cytochrome P450 n=1 Tax=unclassified Streptomyces TaxID=2593676 RepID=UPI0020255EEE|nr:MULTISPECIES: cytochrome P450 [unclassified Streptomyces]MCX4553855.1 cytochrome P450 [Streptomyces sp. NBC_01500]WSC18768.1 cytochrome P450 [Streptomyces sp. NBC_01766]WSV52803.1 cytochrome P450 [Streptomyces sp. NBC_01014]
MTTPFDHRPGTDGAVVPPPECPAHGHGPGGLRRLYGAEAESDPMGLYEKLRAEHGSVAPVLLHGDVPAWLVLGHSENLYMTRTPSLFSRDSRRWRALQDGSATPDHPLAPIFTWQPVCVFADGADHERLRGAVMDAMSYIDTRSTRRFINRFSNRLVNEFCQDGRADLVSRFAEHLPMMVMCQILGMPEEYNERLVQAARDMIKGTETAIASNAYVMAAINRLVAQRRSAPQEDFATRLIEHPAGLSDDEVAQHLRLVLIAAYETTTNLIANVLRMVLTDPRFRAQLSGGHMTVPEAVEQTLWDEPPFTTIFGRWAVGDTELGGQQIKAGDALVVGIAAANIDPVVRPDPHASMQGNRAHLAFSGGAHECPGQDIGRAIADVGVDALLMRLPDVELAVAEHELRWVGSLMSRQLVELPVEFAPRPPQDVMVAPSPAAMPAPRTDWEVTSHPTDGPAPAAQSAPPVQAPPAGPPGSGFPAQRDPDPKGLWQVLTSWWRGY